MLIVSADAQRPRRWAAHVGESAEMELAGLYEFAARKVMARTGFDYRDHCCRHYCYWLRAGYESSANPHTNQLAHNDYHAVSHNNTYSDIDCDAGSHSRCKNTCAKYSGSSTGRGPEQFGSQFRSSQRERGCDLSDVLAVGQGIHHIPTPGRIHLVSKCAHPDCAAWVLHCGGELWILERRQIHSRERNNRNRSQVRLRRLVLHPNTRHSLKMDCSAKRSQRAAQHRVQPTR